MIWILYFIANSLCMILCYLTNPIVCLFANEAGELPGILKLWQTWDDSLNPRFFVIEKVPKILRYDYDRHYKEYWDTTPELQKYSDKRCFVMILDPNFTTKERIQRYFCQVLWLYRNCAYGFSYYLFSRSYDPNNLVKYKKLYDEGRYLQTYYDKSTNLLNKLWSVKCNKRICKGLCWEVYLGWKLSITSRRSMVAQRIAFRFV